MKEHGKPTASDLREFEHSMRALMQILRAEEILHRILLEGAADADAEFGLAGTMTIPMRWQGRRDEELFRN